MKIKLNGRKTEIIKGAGIKEVLEGLCKKPGGVIVELNGEIIPRKKWASKKIKDSDILEVISFMGGG